MDLHKKRFSLDFALGWKNRSWNGTRLPMGQALEKSTRKLIYFFLTVYLIVYTHTVSSVRKYTSKLRSHPDISHSSVSYLSLFNWGFGSAFGNEYYGRFSYRSDDHVYSIVPPIYDTVVRYGLTNRLYMHRMNSQCSRGLYIVWWFTYWHTSSRLRGLEQVFSHLLDMLLIVNMFIITVCYISHHLSGRYIRHSNVW